LLKPTQEADPHETLPRSLGRVSVKSVWAAVDAHQAPSWGRGQRARFEKG
jgi:hypothetical protein